MPANLTPEYLEAEREYKAAKTTEEKLAALERMLSVVPKHKGTEKIQADLKRRISKLKSQAQKKSGKSRADLYHIRKEGAAQVILVGAPNSGKSALMLALTNAPVEVADYPFTTRKLQPGMMPFENIQVQLIDTPAISREYMETWLPGVIRNADFALIVVNLASDDILEELEAVLEKLAARKVELVCESGRKYTQDGLARVRALILGTHLESQPAEQHLGILKELYGKRFPIYALSSQTGEGVELFRGRLFEELHLVRVYTKTPGKPPDKKDPVILPEGATVDDFATTIHKDIAKNLKFARIWGKKKYDGQKVNLDYQLLDEDVVELHT
jgi:ribosome-interacting GTPase 1